MIDMILRHVLPWVPFVVTLLVTMGLLFALDWVLFSKQSRVKIINKFSRQGLMVLLTGVGIVAVVLALPFSDNTKNEILKLLGLLLTGVLAFSSTTFAGNMMAGFMLKAMKNFRPGDFLEVEGHFGRVSGVGMLRTEIQCEDRALVALPNLFLTTHPVKVLRYSGTMISADVSLGYDVPRSRAEDLLRRSALECGLEDPFVHVMNLGDHSITYRVAGLLREVKFVLSKRSWLMACIIDTLHGAGVEIASPKLVNQRQFTSDHAFRARGVAVAQPGFVEESPEDVIFDKAQEAESVEQLRLRLERFEGYHQKMKESLATETNHEAQEHIRQRLETLDKARERVVELIREKTAPSP